MKSGDSMRGFTKFILKDLIQKAEMNPETYSMQSIEDMLSGFSCPLNKDVETFLKRKAIPFEKQGISATHLVFASYKEKPVLVGYFTLASKYFHVGLSGKKLSSNMKHRIHRFGVYEADIKKEIVTAPLIGQVGKNFANGYNQLITGDELLNFACDTVKMSQAIIGGRFVYLECEDTIGLRAFYERNGFIEFGKRMLEEKESRYFKGEYLMQMLKYLK